MTSALSAIGSFVGGLLGLTVPALGCTMWQLILGLWVFYALGNFIFGLLHDDSGGG